MKLTFFQGKVPNFGDELNKDIWHRLLPPGILDDDPSELFLGIGSILWDSYPTNATKYVVGCGYGGYTPPPNVHDGSWEIVFVRGPRTAKTLGIDESKAITDAAILLRALDWPSATRQTDVAFMPHFESLARGEWQKACELAGIELIDPTEDPATIISKLKGAKLLITEAMHGAIVADALRTPWIPLMPIHHQHRIKWLDWTESLDIVYQPQKLYPSTLRELWLAASGRQSNGPVGKALTSSLACPVNRVLTEIAAASLRKIAKSEPNLSRDYMIETATDRALEALHSFCRSRSVIGEDRPPLIA